MKKKTIVSRDMILILITESIKNITKEKKNLVPYWWDNGFLNWLDKRIEKVSEEITDEIRRRKASQSRNKILSILNEELAKYHTGYKLNAKKTK